MIAGPLITSEITSNNFLKKSNAAPVLTCSPIEILSGSFCLTNRTSNPTFALACETGYTPAESACIQFVQKTCSDYNNAIVAEPGYCKYNPAITLYDGQILDYDGRTCNKLSGVDMWFLRYSVTPLAAGATSGPIVCATVFQTSVVNGTIAAPNFRFIPRNITSIHNFVNTQTGAVMNLCPSEYTTYGATQCARPAISNLCDAGGEIGTLVNNAISCSSCPIGKYCKLTQNLTNQIICPNGGTLDTSNQKCIQTNFKYSYTSYVDGCDTASGYIKLGQSCAVKQIRDHDIDRCSYFFASAVSAQYAVTANPSDPSICSTGGGTDFANTDILKTDDTLLCNGPGSGWYNYNVAYDPLVCGNTYDPLNKAAFRWSAATYTKITGLQKLPQTSTACPEGWVEVSPSSSDCYQTPITLTARVASICPANFYCPVNTIEPIACPLNNSSLAGSTSISDCTPNICTNGAINFPTCTCATNQTLVNRICTNNCTNGANNPSACNICPVNFTLVNNSCIANCTNGATNPPSCNNQSSSIISSSNSSSSTSSTSISSSIKSSSSSLSASSNSDCTSAQPGYYIDRTKCSPCQAGYYCPGSNTKPIICPIGYYCPARSATATICPAGKTTKSEGAKEIAECIAIGTVTIAQTPRSGGNQFLITLAILLVLGTLLYIGINTNRRRKLNDWKKIN